MLVNITGRLLRVHFRPLRGERLVVHFFWFTHDDVAASVGKPERNAQQVLKPQPQFFLPLRGYEEQHEPPAARSEKLASKGAGAAPGLINLIQVGVRDVSRTAFSLPASIRAADGRIHPANDSDS